MITIIYFGLTLIAKGIDPVVFYQKNTTITFAFFLAMLFDFINFTIKINKK